MPWQMPAPPDQLVQLLRRQNPMASQTPSGSYVPYPNGVPSAPADGSPMPPDTPLPAATKPVAFGPQPTPQTVADNQTIEGGGQPAPAAQPQPQAPAPPPPSDDPSLSPVKTPEIGNYLNPIMQQQQALNARRAAVPAIDPQQVKPKLWERLLGVALGATQLRNPENAGAVAGQVVNRRLIGAENARNLALQPINEEQDALDKQMPLYSAAGRAAYEQAQLGNETNRENRERAGLKLNNQYKSDWNEIRQQRTDDQQKAAADRNDQQKSALEERERHDTETSGLRRDLNDIRDRRQTELENKPGGGDKRGTPGQFSGIEVKKQQALSKAHSDYQKAVTGLAPDDAEGHKQAAEDLASAQQQAQDAYEQEIVSLGGSAQHVDLATQGKNKSQPAPAAAAAPAEKKPIDSMGGHKVGETVTLKGGQKVKIKQLYSDGSFDHEPVK